jgi:hypothetical protein
MGLSYGPYPLVVLVLIYEYWDTRHNPDRTLYFVY